MKKISQDRKKLAASRFDIVKKIKSFKIKTKTSRFNIKTKTKNLHFQEKLYNLITSLLPVFQGKNRLGNIILQVGLSNINFAKINNGVIFSNTF